MRITAIEKAKGTRYTVYVDGEYWYILDLEIIMKNGLMVSMEVDEDCLLDLKWQAERRKARERAYYLLGYRDHSKKELYDKLLRTANPEIALEIVEMVTQQGLIDDANYAQKLAEYYLLTKRWGAKRAVYEMRKKGISAELAEQAILDCDADPSEQIRAVIDRKYCDSLDDSRGRKKIITALLRLGYCYDDILSVLGEYI